ncbi:hypothetical protein NEDG_00944 [Nematocida displodere]|uniref:N-acetyltransferase domain-containing protein n=1 Tax=Nematocida displodere TaxID=1805483 RepID=A0A177EA63_9MICR|nr:hypothetical protein NEDG_00944 [Nematocida displodere]
MKVLKNTQETERVSLVLGDANKISRIKEVNQKIFPVVYHNDFYQKLFAEDVQTFMLEAFPADQVSESVYAGIVSVRIAKQASEHRKREDTLCVCGNNESSIYVILLGVIEALRGQGYGKGLVSKIEEIARDNSIDHIVLHVQVSNLRAIEFYHKLGFKLIRLVKDYYSNVMPRDAFLLRRCLKKEIMARNSAL